MTMLTAPMLAISAIALVALLMVWRWTKTHPNFDLADLITGDNGRVSATKSAQFGAWLVATWGFVTLVQADKMTEWYFGAYMAASFGVRVAKDALTK